MFEFEDTMFNSSMVTAIEVVDETVSIYVHGRDDSFDFEFDEDDIREKYEEACKAWRDSITSEKPIN